MFQQDETHTFDQATAKEWFDVAKQLAVLKVKEAELRKQMADAAFPEADRKEGANNKLDIGDGYILQLDHKINRTIDEASVRTLTEDMRQSKVSIDDVFVSKLSLGKSAYNKLSEDQLKLVDQCITEKPGTPGLKIVKPKNAC